MNENVKAYEYLHNRGVTRLCHFTKIKSLTHILTSEDGILATAFIPSDVLQQNDMERFDNAKDFVCCSIQYPNSWYWKKVKERDEDAIFREWVTLTLELNIIKDISFKFCRFNAGKLRGTHINSDLSKISELYSEPTIQNKYRTPQMLSCCPSDDQAEILVYKNIPIDYINGIFVGNADCANNIAAILKTVGKKIRVFVAPDLCNTEWSSMIRRGEKPTEAEYEY